MYGCMNLHKLMCTKIHISDWACTHVNVHLCVDVGVSGPWKFNRKTSQNRWTFQCAFSKIKKQALTKLLSLENRRVGERLESNELWAAANKEQQSSKAAAAAERKQSSSKTPAAATAVQQPQPQPQPQPQQQQQQQQFVTNRLSWPQNQVMYREGSKP